MNVHVDDIKTGDDRKFFVVAAKAIAAGTRPGKDGTTILKLVLQLVPYLAAPTQGTINLHSWPRDVYSWLARENGIASLSLKLLHEKSGDSLTANALPIKLPKFSKNMDKTVEEATTLWQKAISHFDVLPEGAEPGNESIWDILAKEIENRSGSNNWKVAEGADSKNISSIIPNNQHSQAVMLETSRAQQLANTIKSPPIRVKISKPSNDPQKFKTPAEQAEIDKKDYLSATTQEHRDVAEKKLDENHAFEAKALWNDWAKDCAELGRNLYDTAKNGELQICESLQELSAEEVLSTSTAEVLDDNKSKSLMGHAYATWGERNPKLTPYDQKNAYPDALARRFYNIQSTPKLARMFLFDIDAEVEIPDSELKNIRGVNVQLVLVGGDGIPLSPIVKTLARFESEGNQFWPALRGCKENGAQHNGIARLAVRNMFGHPRYDLSSIDVNGAAENAMETERRYLTYQAALMPNVPSEEFLTGGFSLYDTDAHREACQRLAMRDKQNSAGSEVLLDARDLLLGYILDVGTPATGSDKMATEWRSLMRREIRIEEKSFAAKLSDIFAGDNDDATRLDHAFIASGLKLRQAPKIEADQKETEREAIVDELMFTWDGSPMGVSCAGSQTLKTDNEDLPFSRTFSLPNKGEDLPVELRFGWPYRVGLRCRYQAGVNIPLALAKAMYNDVATNAAIPMGYPQDGQSYRRFLRHERIGAPNVLLPESLVDNPDTVMGFEVASLAVVRSVNVIEKLKDKPDLERRANPKETVRYVMPPGIHQELAIKHGMYDAGEPRLHQGIVINPLNGGFPAGVNHIGHGLNDETYISKRDIDVLSNSPSEPVFSCSKSTRKIVSDRYANIAEKLLELGKDPKVKTPYLPDPAAQKYVVALRYAGTDTYVKDSAATQVIDAVTVENGNIAAPLKIVVKRYVPTERPYPGLMEKTDALVKIQEPNKDSVALGRTVTINLRAGEDFDVDIWCIPTKETLSRNFAILESFASLACRKGAEGLFIKDTSKITWEVLAKGLGILCRTDGNGEDFDRWLTRAKIISNAPEPLGMLNGTDHKYVPGKDALRNIAAFLIEVLQTRPVVEISCVSSFRAVHATNRPLRVPSFVVTSNCDDVLKNQPILATRLLESTRDEMFTQPDGQRYEKYFAGAWHGEPCTSPLKKLPIQEDAHDCFLGGKVLVDTDSSNRFEIHVKTAFPRSKVFDDVNHRRSIADRRAGKWPHEPLLPSAVVALKLKAQPPADLKKELSHLLPPASIYGFHVMRDESVRLPRTSVTLLSVEGLQTTQHAKHISNSEGLEEIRLDSLYGIVDRKGRYKSALNEPGGATIPTHLTEIIAKLPHAFPDGKARLLGLTIESYARHASLMTIAASNGAGAIPLPDDSDSLSSPMLQLWLDATVRPAKPKTRSPFPAFLPTEVKEEKTEKGYKKSVIRRSLLRVPLDRGWFSSGEEERLGIVLWPPNLFEVNSNSAKTAVSVHKFDEDKILFRNDWVATDGERASGRQIDIPDFVDEDLGPGGVFITRWGGDPIRGSEAGVTGHFVPPGQFQDKFHPNVHGHDVRFFIADMPVAKVENTSGATASDDKSITQYMKIGLLTYLPKFDVDQEEWYVDIDLLPGRVPDPFVRLGLVRFQEHAPQTLQVSEPVVEWGQLLPERGVDVEVTNEGPICIIVRIFGTFANRFAVASSEYGTAIAVNQMPRLKLTLGLQKSVMIDKSANKNDDLPQFVHRHVLREWDIDSTNPAEYHVGNTEVFTKTILLDDLPGKNISDYRKGTYYLMIEEYEARPRATYPQEPVPLLNSNPDFAEDYINSGARFLARIELKLPDLKVDERSKDI